MHKTENFASFLPVKNKLKLESPFCFVCRDANLESIYILFWSIYLLCNFDLENKAFKNLFQLYHKYNNVFVVKEIFCIFIFFYFLAIWKDILLKTTYQNINTGNAGKAVVFKQVFSSNNTWVISYLFWLIPVMFRMYILLRNQCRDE